MTDSHKRQKPGPGKPLTAQRELYFRLMKQGLNNSEACRLVRTHHSTCQHWRHGRRLRNNGREYYYRPITAAPTPVSAASGLPLRRAAARRFWISCRWADWA